MNHLLVLGAQGQIGRAVVARAFNEGVVCVAPTRLECDITDAAAVANAVAGSGIVINCAAYTAVDRAESEVETAYRVNAIGAGNVAAACAQANIPLIHLSTDYVFAGECVRPLKEDDVAQPLNAYGRSKLEGEVAVRERLRAHIVLRTSWVFSSTGQNFVKTMLRLAEERREIRVVEDQIGGPTAADDIAVAVLRIARISTQMSFAEWGTYHFSGSPAASWYEFASAILRDWEGKLVPISSQDYSTPARRPLYSVLDCSRISRVFGLQSPDWRISLRKVCDQLTANSSA
jgi:dTDP-4-dehydrorhamnose reductase